MQRSFKCYALDKLGQFCMALQDDGVGFAHLGSGAIAVSKHPDDFPAHSRRLYDELREDGLLEELQHPRLARPRLVAPEEAKAVMEEWVRRWNEPIEKKMAILITMTFTDREVFRHAVAVVKQYRLPFLAPKPSVLVVPKTDRARFAGLKHDESEVQFNELPPASAQAIRFLRLSSTV